MQFGRFFTRRALPVLGIATLGYGVLWDSEIRNVPETFVGFPELRQGYHVENFYVPTRGDVTRVEKLEGRDYEVIRESDGDIVYEGPFRYEIRPQPKFAPNSEVHTDMHGNTPENCSYWRDTRNGWVRLEKSNQWK